MDPASNSDEQRLTLARTRMVERQLSARGIRQEQVLSAMAHVPRHAFVDPRYRDDAYGDFPLPIGHGQTISQPYMVALMTELCAPFDGARALEVGAGCGYQTAVLSLLCREVLACEVVAELVDPCRDRLLRLGFIKATVSSRDGSLGWPEQAPYDIILVAAGAPEVPAPLKAQLADGGRLVIPVGGRETQVLRRIVRRGDDFETTFHTPCRFVNLKGRHGWPDAR